MTALFLTASLGVLVPLLSTPGTTVFLWRGGRLVEPPDWQGYALHVADWQRVYSAYIVAALLTLAGVSLLAVRLWMARLRILPLLALVFFSVGTGLWLASLEFRTAVSGPAATAFVGESSARRTPGRGTAILEGSYLLLDRRAELLYATYMMLAYVGIVLLGIALWKRRLVHPAFAASSIGMAGVAANFFIIQLPDFPQRAIDLSDSPLWIHAWSSAVGIGLLLRPWRWSYYGSIDQAGPQGGATGATDGRSA